MVSFGACRVCEYSVCFVHSLFLLQAEAAASLGRVHAAETSELMGAREAAVAELQRLRVAVRAVAQHLFDARNQSAASAEGFTCGNGSSNNVYGLEDSELRSMLGAVLGSGGDEEEGAGASSLTTADAAAAFHGELTAILNAPLDEEALRGVLISLAEERAKLDASAAHSLAITGSEQPSVTSRGRVLIR